MSMPIGRVLIVEDDPDIVRVVRAYLERDNYTVEVAYDGLSGLELALETPPSLIVLDWMLPGIDGPEFMRRLRHERRTPVIMLTARKEEADRVLGLELGADDYVSKPFSPRELSARVKAVLRRTAEPAPPSEGVAYAGLRLDTAHRRATFHGAPLELTRVEFDLLYTFVSLPGRVFSRDDLLRRVWGEDFGGVDRVVDVHVSNLRQKLEAVRPGEALIVTLRGLGYKFRDREAAAR